MFGNEENSIEIYSNYKKTFILQTDTKITVFHEIKAIFLLVYFVVSVHMFLLCPVIYIPHAFNLFYVFTSWLCSLYPGWFDKIIIRKVNGSLIHGQKFLIRWLSSLSFLRLRSNKNSILSIVHSQVAAFPQSFFL